MPIKTIQSYSELASQLKPGEKSYVLLYKSGSEASECSLANLNKAAASSEKFQVMLADVNQVRDIHTRFEIGTVPSLLIFEGTEYSNVIKGCNDPSFYIGLFQDALYHAQAAASGQKQKHVTVYTTPSCSWCTTLKNYLKSQQIRFTEIDVSRNQSAAEEMVRRSGQQGVPQTNIEGEVVVGFDRNRINTLLGIQQHTNN